MRHRLARLGAVAYLAISIAAPGFVSSQASASYQTTDGDLGTMDPVTGFPSTGDIAGSEMRGVLGEIPALSGSDLKGEPSLLDDDWLSGDVQDTDERDYIVRIEEPVEASESGDEHFSGWIFATVAFFVFQVLYSTIRLAGRLANAERDRPLGSQLRNQYARDTHRRHRKLGLRRVVAKVLPAVNRLSNWSQRDRAV